MKKEMVNNRTKNVLRNICISTVILFLGIIILLKSFKVTPGGENVIYSYNINKNVNYTVGIQENGYYTDKVLEMDKAYISSLVDKINMDFTYSLAGNKKVKTKYIYQMVAISTIRYSDSMSEEEADPIWTKQYVLKEPKELEHNGANFVIKENVEIDFKSYNEEVKEFKKEFKVPIVADLQVKLYVRSETEVPTITEPVKEISIMNVKMDLNEDVFKVEKDFKNVETKKMSETIETKKEVDKLSFAIGCILIIAAVMMLLDAIRRSIKFGKKTDYEIALSRILKNYGDIVAEIVSPIEIDNLNIIDVKNFDQLLDIEEEIRMPILFYETIEGEQGEFIIICDNMAYRYVIG